MDVGAWLAPAPAPVLPWLDALHARDHGDGGVGQEVMPDVDAMENEHFTKDHMVEERKNMNIVYHISLSLVVILSQEINVR